MNKLKNITAWVLMSIPCAVVSATDSDCLNHLGGAFADVECYNSLSNDLAAQNKHLITQLKKVIPRHNKNLKLLSQYEHAQIAQNQFCQLSRDSLTEWVPQPHGTTPRYFYYDVAYYQCVHQNALNQNLFLKKLLNKE